MSDRSRREAPERAEGTRTGSIVAELCHKQYSAAGTAIRRRVPDCLALGAVNIDRLLPAKSGAAGNLQGKPLSGENRAFGVLTYALRP
ncbi:MAG: hypothetical protein ACU83O_11185 [Gammaproteobacteria bacterium]